MSLGVLFSVVLEDLVNLYRSVKKRAYTLSRGMRLNSSGMVDALATPPAVDSGCIRRDEKQESRRRSAAHFLVSVPAITASWLEPMCRHSQLLNQTVCDWREQELCPVIRRELNCLGRS